MINKLPEVPPPRTLQAACGRGGEDELGEREDDRGRLFKARLLVKGAALTRGESTPSCLAPRQHAVSWTLRGGGILCVSLRQQVDLFSAPRVPKEPPLTWPRAGRASGTCRARATQGRVPRRRPRRRTPRTGFPAGRNPTRTQHAARVPFREVPRPTPGAPRGENPSREGPSPRRPTPLLTTQVTSGEVRGFIRYDTGLQVAAVRN